MYFWGALIGFGYMFAKDHESVLMRGPFHDFDMWVWIALSAHVIMGISASLVFKYLNNIVFLFIQTACMLAVALISIPVFKFKFSPSFVIALVLILVASYMYKREAIRKKSGELFDYYMGGGMWGGGGGKGGKAPAETGTEQEQAPEETGTITTGAPAAAVPVATA